MSFNEDVWNVKLIPNGKVSTYKYIAEKILVDRKINYKRLSLYCRAVGNALNKNPFSPIVPCHRVVSSDGSVGGFAFGINKKIKMLKSEGLKIKDDKIVDFENVLFSFALKKGTL